VTDVIECLEFADRAHQEALLSAGHFAGADGEVRAFEGIAQPGDVDAVGGKPDRIDQYPQFEWLDTFERDASHAVEAFQRLLEIAVQRVVLAREVFLARDAHGEDAVVTGGEHLRQDPVGARREFVADRLELGPHLEPDGRRVPVPLEEDDEFRAGLGRGRTDLLRKAE